MRLASGFAGDDVVAENPLVRKLRAYSDLDSDDMARLEELCVNVHCIEPRCDIIGDGQRPEHNNLMLEGWGARYKDLPDGERQIVGFLIPGDFCDLHVTLLGKMDHGICALTRCRVAYVPDQLLTRITSSSATLARAFWRSTLVDEAILRSWVINNGQRDAVEAVAHLFCEMHLRMTNVGLVRDHQFTVPVTQQDLGDALGMSMVHTNRALQNLRAESLIQFAKKELTILDLDRLRQRARFDPSYLHLRRE